MLLEKFIKQSSQATSVIELLEVYKTFMFALGFNKVFFSLVTDHIAIEKTAGHALILNEAGDWTEMHIDESSEIIDSIRFSMYSSDSSFILKHRLEGGFLDKGLRSKKLSKLADDKDFLNCSTCIAVPLRGARGAIACICASNSNLENIDFEDQGMIGFVNLAAHQFYSNFIKLEKGKSSIKDNVKELCLSDREVEILQWCSKGKTKWEIGKIISISEHTVDYHIRNILKKFETKNISLAVVRALNMGVVQC